MDKVPSSAERLIGEELTHRHIDVQIDAAYRTKYRRDAAGLISHIMSPEARSATFKLVLRS